jgi:mannose-6-phosphate isomerase-like protein (cupin superfamily)
MNGGLRKVSLAEKLTQFTDAWSPKIVGELNGQQVKLVKLRDEFVWHHHDSEDELFLVVGGVLRMDYRDAHGFEQHLSVREGEFVIVPHGVEHRPVAEGEVSVLLFEPASTVNTGNVRSERTVEELERL